MSASSSVRSESNSIYSNSEPGNSNPTVNIRFFDIPTSAVKPDETRISLRQVCLKGLIIQKTPQLPAPARMLELAQRLGLDLADALAGDRELLAHLFQRMVGVHADAE